MPPVAIGDASPRPTSRAARRRSGIDSPVRRSRRGTSSDAPKLSSARTAKPSMLERSKPGTSIAAHTSAASTRPCACSSGDELGAAHVATSIAASQRRSASSRSSTSRNCCCFTSPPDRLRSPTVPRAQHSNAFPVEPLLDGGCAPTRRARRAGARGRSSTSNIARCSARTKRSATAASRNVLERRVVAVDVEQRARLLVQAELRPGPGLEGLLERADAAGQRDEGSRRAPPSAPCARASTRRRRAR